MTSDMPTSFQTTGRNSSEPDINIDKTAVLVPKIERKVTVQSRAKVTGSLVSLSHATSVVNEFVMGGTDVKNQVVINFPSMPSNIDLVRSANYTTHPNYILPDGVHMYKSTNPLEIPFSFELAAFDREFCPRGAVSLIELGAALHALELPIRDKSDEDITTETAGIAYNKDKTADRIEVGIEKATDRDVVILGGLNTKFPVAVKLWLMYAGENLPGISCVGYVKQVSVSFREPFLRGPDNQFNLPSFAVYGFTFVHVPGYTNVFDGSNTGSLISNRQVNSYADDVKNDFYNSIKLIIDRSPTYQGFKT